jgi:ribonuclease R
MVCDMDVTPQGAIKSYRFYPAVMHSRARLTYTEVWSWLSEPKTAKSKDAKALLPHLANLHALYEALAAARQRRGAIDFESAELSIEFDEHGKITAIVPAPRNDAHKVIEECMLAANVCAADFLGKRKQTTLFRVHEPPPPEKLAALREFLATSALHLSGGEKPTAADYAKLLDTARERADFDLLQTVLLRSLSQAQYRPDNEGHFGLAYDAYAHFTSPIRRYPDLLVHRAIMSALQGTVYAPAGMTWQQLGVHTSMTERRADEAARDVVNWLKAHYMQDHVGEEFDGTISGVTSFGLFVTLDGLAIDGLVHITELGRDYFHFDAARHALVGERSGVTFQLAGRIRVKVARVDLEQAKIDFVLGEQQPAEVSRPRPVFAEPLSREDRPRKGKARR